MDTTVVALYDNLTTAQQALDRLVNSGFSRDRISLMANDAANEYSRHLTPSDKVVRTGDAVTAGEGAGFGATVGALTGIVVGLGAFMIPGIGPVLGAGPVVAGLAALTGGVVGAAAGGATGGLVGGLVKTGITAEDAEYYAEGVRRGGTLVVVNTTDSDSQQAHDILNSFSPVDIHERGSAWRESGWKGYDPNAAPYTPEQIEGFRTAKIQRGQLTNTPETRKVYDVPDNAKDRIL